MDQFSLVVSLLKARVVLTTAYAAGLRISRMTGLEIVDIDSDRMAMRIERGMGGKLRDVMLSGQLLGILRKYWRPARSTRVWTRRIANAAIAKFLEKQVDGLTNPSASMSSPLFQSN